MTELKSTLPNVQLVVSTAVWSTYSATGLAVVPLLLATPSLSGPRLALDGNMYPALVRVWDNDGTRSMTRR